MNKSFIPQARLSVNSARTAHDAISTSSSTLVNPDLDEDVVRRRQYRQPLVNDRSNVHYNMKSAPFTSDGWLKDENANPSSSFNRSIQPQKEYPDDHRCSDQETASGLCGCNRDVSPGSGSSTGPATVSEQEEENKMIRSDSSYDQLLLAARKRKLMIEKRSQSPENITVMRAEILENTPMSYSKSSGNQSRDLQSDPVLVARPASHRFPHSYNENHRSVDYNQEGEREMSRGIPDRRWASSPIQASSYEQSRRSSLSQPPLFEQKSRSQNDLGKSSNNIPTPPSAARKSISSVFEKLLKEEEQKREEERTKKEAARERRRESKRRKEEEWPRSIDAKSDMPLERSGSPKLQSQARDIDADIERVSNGSKDVSSQPEVSNSASTSQLQQDTTRLERLSRKSPLSSSIAKIAPRPSPEKPAASSYKAKLAALRSASVEEKVAPFPIYRLNDPPSFQRQSKSKSISFDHSSSDDSHAPEGDLVTNGSDFQGQAPLQSTPPRNSPSARSRLLIESPTARMKASESSLVEDSLRQTVQQLTAVLNEVRDIKGEGDFDSEQLPIVDLNRANEQRELALQTVSNEGRKRITDIDEVYVQKLDQIRERLKGAKSKTPVDRIEKRSQSFRLRNVIYTIILQLLFAWLMMMAAEVRARQLFLTTYYDPFLPHDVMDSSYAHSGSLLGPLLEKWSLIPANNYYMDDDLTQSSQTWTNTLSWAAHDLVRGPDRRRAVRLLSSKVITVFGLDFLDTNSFNQFVPT